MLHDRPPTSSASITDKNTFINSEIEARGILHKWIKENPNIRDNSTYRLTH